MADGGERLDSPSQQHRRWHVPEQLAHHNPRMGIRPSSGASPRLVVARAGCWPSSHRISRCPMASTWPTCGASRPPAEPRLPERKRPSVSGHHVRPRMRQRRRRTGAETRSGRSIHRGASSRGCRQGAASRRWPGRCCCWMASRCGTSPSRSARVVPAPTGPAGSCWSLGTRNLAGRRW